ncbi:MAG: DALR domain-containing protein, partial [Tepidisphaeraceae bacterium]
MDDDFNTAGAIGVLHELAGEINAFIEQTHAEREKQADVVQAVGASTQSLRSLAGLLGLFTAPTTAPANDVKQIQTLDAVMNLLIRLRNDARKQKNFALSDGIRDGLAEIGITLEDRAGETSWRKN